jgi:hypothetical protein
MLNSKKLKQLVLVLGSISALSLSATAMARTTDEELAARALRYEQANGSAEASSAAEAAEDDYTTVSLSSGNLIIYRENGHPSVAAHISVVSRFKNYIFVKDEFAGEWRLIPYFTESGARSSFNQIVAGASVDVSSCMSEDRQLSREMDRDTGCTTRTFTTKVDCGRLTSVGIRTLSGAEAAAYKIVNIDASPLTDSSYRCPREHGVM